MSYKVSKQNKEVFIAKRRSEKSIIEYEFERKDKGWYVRRTHLEVEAAFPKVDDMYLPDEVVEQILLIESAKKELTDGEQGFNS